MQSQYIKAVPLGTAINAFEGNRCARMSGRTMHPVVTKRAEGDVAFPQAARPCRSRSLRLAFVSKIRMCVNGLVIWMGCSDVFTERIEVREVLAADAAVHALWIVWI